MGGSVVVVGGNAVGGAVVVDIAVVVGSVVGTKATSSGVSDDVQPKWLLSMKKNTGNTTVIDNSSVVSKNARFIFNSIPFRSFAVHCKTALCAPDFFRVHFGRAKPSLRKAQIF